MKCNLRGENQMSWHEILNKKDTPPLYPLQFHFALFRERERTEGGGWVLGMRRMMAYTSNYCKCVSVSLLLLAHLPTLLADDGTLSLYPFFCFSFSFSLSLAHVYNRIIHKLLFFFVDKFMLGLSRIWDLICTQLRKF